MDQRLTGAAELPQPRALVGQRFLLRRVDVTADLSPLHAHSHGSPDLESIWDWMSYGPFATEEAMGAWLLSSASSRDPLFFTIVERVSGEPVGMASFLRMVQEMRTIEIGHIWVQRRVQGSGVLQELAYVMMREAFDVLGYRRLEWKCNALNERSRRAALSLGFTFEGVFRQHMIVKGRNRDSAWFSMLDREWPTARVALEQRIGLLPPSSP